MTRTDTTTLGASSRTRAKTKRKNGKGPKPTPTPRLQAPKRTREREPKYSIEVMDEILRRMSHGETLGHICRSNPDFPAASTVIDWVHENRANIAERYARARNRQIEAWADQILDKADEALGKPELANAARVAVDARKFLLSKLRPEVYGDRVELSGPGGRDLFPTDGTATLEWLKKTLADAAVPTPPAVPLVSHEAPAEPSTVEAPAPEPEHPALRIVGGYEPAGEHVLRFNAQTGKLE